MFQTHSIFCATPWELEEEQSRFHHLVGHFNETAAMPKGVLYVPITLTNIRDKRAVQYAVNENVCECRHYVLVLSEDWGPVERNFKADYQLALQSVADPALPMTSVAVLFKKQSSGSTLAPGLPEPHATFSSLEEFDGCINRLLSEWMESSAQEV
jgi:hypothetical protein